MFSRAEELFESISQDDEVLQVFKYHSLRVMHLSSSLAKSLDCFDEDLKVAGLLHDIGKIGLSKDILLKPSRLTDLEYEIIKAHSHIGNNIVRKKLDMPRAALFIRDHHERWDGKGYPRGLSEDNISLQGRIIGICDAFDTMTIDRRNYNKDTLTFDEALDELKRCSWTQFDGDLVNSFIKLVKDMDLPETEAWSKDQNQMKKIF